jgi:hypothetical protein
MFSGAYSLNIIWFLFGLGLAGVGTYRLEQKALYSKLLQESVHFDEMPIRTW